MIGTESKNTEPLQLLPVPGRSGTGTANLSARARDTYDPRGVPFFTRKADTGVPNRPASAPVSGLVLDVIMMASGAVDRPDMTVTSTSSLKSVKPCAFNLAG